MSDYVEEANVGADDDIPAPDEIALAAMQGLLANPAYAENPAAAVHHAWVTCVQAYYEARGQYGYILQQMQAASEQG